MKKRIIMTITLTALVLAITGCGGKKEKGSDNAGTAVSETTQETDTADDAQAAGVSADAQTAGVSADAIGTELREKIAYKDELSEIDTETLKMYIYLDDISIDEAKIYESTGATAEEIVVLKCGSPDDAKKAEAAFEQRIEEQKEAYENYVPEEMVKLGKPVIITKNEYAILSVSDEPDKAKDIIGAYIK
ncbi:MAG: DUF4358 domain-containing protein [Lachnospiraceae bacterium]|nr:DUF4358 domain-containing protein [Lachnospiraceae bacterium]